MQSFDSISYSSHSWGKDWKSGARKSHQTHWSGWGQQRCHSNQRAAGAEQILHRQQHSDLESRRHNHNTTHHKQWCSAKRYSSNCHEQSLTAVITSFTRRKRFPPGPDRGAGCWDLQCVTQGLNGHWIRTGPSNALKLYYHSYHTAVQLKEMQS